MKVRLIIKDVSLPPIGSEVIVSHYTTEVLIEDEKIKELLKRGAVVVGAEVIKEENTIKEEMEKCVKVKDICDPSSKVMQIIEERVKELIREV